MNQTAFMKFSLTSLLMKIPKKATQTLLLVIISAGTLFSKPITINTFKTPRLDLKAPDLKTPGQRLYFDDTTIGNKGVLYGTVTDSNGNFLAFALITIKELDKSIITEIDGKFNLRLPVGQYTVVANYLGYVDYKTTINIADNAIENIVVVLKENQHDSEEGLAYGTLSRGQAKALNEQKGATNIKNVVSYEQFSKYPDRNAAEALQRISGIAISRDQGEGELISIRGMSPRLNAVQINGMRIPSPDPDIDRAVGLDLLQVDLMESIVVNKTLLPDMDGDAIGGSVDFRLKPAPDQPMVKVSASAGYNQQQSEFNDMGNGIQSYSAVVGNRFFNKKLGIIASGSYYNTDRGSLLNRYNYEDTTTILKEKRQTDYDINRERYGVAISPDFKFNENHRLKFIANINVYNDDEIRRRVDYQFDRDDNYIIEDGEESRQIRNRGEYQQHYLYQLAGEHKFEFFNLDYTFGLTHAKESMPDRTQFRFERDVDFSSYLNEQLFNLNVKDNPGGDTPLLLNRVRYDDNINRDEDLSAKLDLTFPIQLFGLESEFKVGGKVLHKERLSAQRRFEIRVDEDENPISMEGGLFILPNIRYDNPQVAALNIGEFEEEEDRGDGEDYSATENIQAFYGKLTMKLNQKLSLVTGTRVEITDNRYNAIRSDGFEEVNTSNYTNWLPSLQMKYNLTDKTIFRAGYSTGFTRPSFYSLVPAPDDIDDDNFIIDRKNSSITPATANNFDIIFERYSDNLGVISIAGFAKFIGNQILREQTLEEINGDTYTVYQDNNGATASSIGVEASITHKFLNYDIPLLKWFGMNLNYTYAHSEMKAFNEVDEGQIVQRKVPFQSPKHVFNTGIFYENPNQGLTLTLSGNYRSAILIGIADDERSDIYLSEQFHLDASASKTIGEKFSVYLQLNNLTDELEEETFGAPSKDYSRIRETEGYGFWGTLGVRFNL